MSTLLPFAATRAFEASARHLSFTRAADELCVTQSAVSRHIRQLETHLGVQLFTRGRALALTPDGQQFHRELADIFRRLEKATKTVVRSRRGPARLQVHTHGSFALMWLAPRLERFRQACPEIDLRLSTAPHSTGLEPEQEHAVIRIGPGPLEGADRLFRVDIVPVCSAAVQARFMSAGSPSALAHAPLLHSAASGYIWPTWLERTGNAGAAAIDLSRGVHFESSAMACTAAERGLGVAMAQHAFVHDALERGDLVAPFPTAVATNRAYYLAPPQQPASDAFTKFRRWLLDEAHADADRIARRSRLTTLAAPF